ncbi:hypothetical protein Y032_0028g1834 [Ancylostoma ceylanicum]|uniref:Peptidase C1A papain C-terminal domain-containing protein n=1 Tax=Ancylostoma ceylanicum TaxID=53326 RepID=A0A016USH4_9BILA|nr:hypothetical protein Y032_0028g1834 [Ancylostoma ceylanicum]
MLFLLPLIVAALAAENGGAGQQELTGQALVDYVRTHQNLFEVEESEKNNERMKYLMPVDFIPRPRDEDRIKMVVNRKLPERKACKYGYKTPYEKDKYYAKSAYILPNDEAVIRQEILANGPVQAVFNVYEDFRLYRRGIYKHTAGKKTGSHAVKIYGWGTQQIRNSTHTIVTPFWFIANSWNVDWGERGYFRMVRGEDNCGLESMVTAGLMAT